MLFFLYASNTPISCLYILACFCPYALQNSEDEIFGCFCGWVIVSNERASVVFGLYLISKAKSCSIFSLIKKSHQWCILLALKSRIGLYSLMIGKHTNWQYVCLQLSFQSIAQKLGPLLQLQCSPLKSFGYSINVLVKKTEQMLSFFSSGRFFIVLSHLLNPWILFAWRFEAAGRPRYRPGKAARNRALHILLKEIKYWIPPCSRQKICLRRDL